MKLLLTEKWSEVNLGLVWTLFPILALLMLIAVVCNLAQVGILFLPDKVAPDPSHINPYKGVKRLFSLTNAVKLGFGIFKIMIVMGVAVLCRSGPTGSSSCRSAELEFWKRPDC